MKGVLVSKLTLSMRKAERRQALPTNRDFLSLSDKVAERMPHGWDAVLMTRVRSRAREKDEHGGPNMQAVTPCRISRQTLHKTGGEVRSYWLPCKISHSLVLKPARLIAFETLELPAKRSRTGLFLSWQR